MSIDYSDAIGWPAEATSVTSDATLGATLAEFMRHRAQHNEEREAKRERVRKWKRNNRDAHLEGKRQWWARKKAKNQAQLFT